MERVFNLNEHTEKTSLKSALTSTNFGIDLGTPPNVTSEKKLAQPMQQALNSFRRDMSSFAKKVCIVIFQGVPDDLESIPGAVRAWERNNVELFFIQIGRQGRTHIRGSTGKLFRASDFSDVGRTAASLMNDVCQEMGESRCRHRNGGCEHTCLSTGRCSCRIGYTLQIDGKKCRRRIGRPSRPGSPGGRRPGGSRTGGSRIGGSGSSSSSSGSRISSSGSRSSSSGSRSSSSGSRSSSLGSRSRSRG